jgi:hypothetical protein
MKDAATGWLGVVLLIAAAVAVLTVDLGRELSSDERRHPRWIAVVAFGAVPVLILCAAVVTVVRIFTLAG